ncbi:MAG: hypothetical protein IIA09_16725 [Proteobacteria bacterium]|nr:hypothetical protein [Pseudomonadota bacterium]
MTKKKIPHSKYTEFPRPLPDGFDFRVLAGVLLTDAESAAWRKYVKQHPDGPSPPEHKRYIDAFEKVQAEMPIPENEREERIYWGAQTLGTINALINLELFWAIRQTVIQKASQAKIREKFDPKYERIGEAHDKLKKKIGDLPARKKIAAAEGYRLSSLNRVLKKTGRR